MDFLQAAPHRRLNPLTGEWVLVSPHRTERPWMGQTEAPGGTEIPAYDPDCYLCPGNRRAHGAVNPRYAHTFVFDNDFPALLPQSSGERIARGGLLVGEAERGVCRVICFSPRHDLTLARMSVEDIERVVQVWRAQYQALGAIDGINAVQIFENRGAMMGASNPHPHCQVWATESLPNEMAKELATQTAYWREHGQPLLLDYLELEQEVGERIVFENEHFTVLVPFWAIWPFETLVLPRRHVGAIDDLSGERVDRACGGLARAHHPLRQPVRDVLPLFDGLSPAPDRRRRARRMAAARSFLPAAPALGDGAQVHGRLRDARLAATGHHRGKRGGAAARPLRQTPYTESG